MKTITKELFRSFSIIAALTVLSIGVANAQNALQFTGVNATSEKAIQLHWASNTNEVYEIDYADQLAGNPDGSTAWNKLYDDYPSQGTNTFIADAGNYDVVPEIPHPKLSPMRFYRVALTGANSSPTNPTVTVTFPTNGSSLSGDVIFSVSASSPEFLTDVKLYIDGEEQWRSNDGTNFLVNTCEWPNGPHVIFAAARSQSAIEGFSYSNPITYGSTVSPYVNVTFDNLISSFGLSQPYFEPALGQTQQVTVTFAANCNWTLQIQDAYSNTVRTATGSGISATFNWDGTGDGETAIPDGVYTYLLSAQTNGQAYQSSSDGSDSGGSGTPPSPSFASMTSGASADSMELWAMSADGSGTVVPFKLYPPGFDTNNLIIFEASPSQMETLNRSVSGAESDGGMDSGPMAQFDANTPSAQSTRGPTRKPGVGVKNSSGSFGICYQTYPNGFYSQQPLTGEPWPLEVFTGVDGNGPNSGYIPWSTLKSFKQIADGFKDIMKIGSTNGTYKPVFIKGDGAWGPLDIESSSLGGNSIFNTCNFGLLLTHGVYGTHPEIDGVLYTYLALFDPKHGPSYVRLSDMNFGSSGKNGLKWITILSCHMLFPDNITSMANNSKLPDNANLHLLLGATTFTYGTPTWGVYYATNMLANISIWQSFQNTGQVAYKESHDLGVRGMTQSVAYRVMGYASCVNDTLFLYNDPNPNSGYQILDQTVFTP